MAEGVMRSKIKQHQLDWIVGSAGTESYHIGEPPFPLAQKICARHGIDISAQRAKRFTRDALANYDKIYAMAEDVYDEMRVIAGTASMDKVDLFLNELEPGHNQSVPDPYYGNEMNFVAVYDMINRTCDAIIENYK